MRVELHQDVLKKIGLEAFLQEKLMTIPTIPCSHFGVVITTKTNEIFVGNKKKFSLLKFTVRSYLYALRNKCRYMIFFYLKQYQQQ